MKIAVVVTCDKCARLTPLPKKITKTTDAGTFLRKAGWAVASTHLVCSDCQVLDQAALAVYAKLVRKSHRKFRVVYSVKPNIWYDFQDGPAGPCGQCRQNEDGAWQQAPLGERPTILSYRH